MLLYLFIVISIAISLILYHLREFKHLENFINNTTTCLIKNKSINMYVNEINPLKENLRDTWYYEYDNAYFNNVFRENCPNVSRRTKTQIKTHALIKDQTMNQNTALIGNAKIIFETWINSLKKLQFDNYNEKMKIIDIHIIKSTQFKLPTIFCIIVIHRKYKFHGKIIKTIINIANQKVLFAHVTDNIIEYDVLSYEKLNMNDQNTKSLHLHGNDYYYKKSKDEYIIHDVGFSCTDSYENMINCDLRYSDLAYLRN